jgi:hypothetical protein
MSDRISEEMEIDTKVPIYFIAPDIKKTAVRVRGDVDGRGEEEGCLAI